MAKTTDASISLDISRAWSDVLMRMAQSWVFNCDGGCFASVCEREAWTVGGLLVIYQPHKSMKEYDDMIATIFIKRTDKGKITAAQLRNAHLEQVNNMVLLSYNDILDKSGGKWTHAIDGTLDALLQTRKPLALEDGTLKYTFEIRGATDGCCGDRWWPHRLAAFRGELSDSPADDEEFLQRCKKDAKRADV